MMNPDALHFHRLIPGRQGQGGNQRGSVFKAQTSTASSQGWAASRTAPPLLLSQGRPSSLMLPPPPLSDTGLCLSPQSSSNPNKQPEKSMPQKVVSLALLNPDHLSLWACVKRHFAAFEFKVPKSLFICARLT